MKQFLLASTVLVAGTSTAFAGGMEVGRFNPGFMFQGGNYAELSMTSTNMDVTDDRYSPNGSMLNDMININASVNMALNDKISIGLSHYDAGKIDLSYAGNGSPFAALPDPTAAAGYAAQTDPATQAAVGAYMVTNEIADPQAGAAAAIANDPDTQAAVKQFYAGLVGLALTGQMDQTNGGALPKAAEPYVDLSFKSTALVLNYAVNDNMSVFGGVKYSTGKATGNVLSSPHGDLVADSDSAASPILGVSYARPDIALRVSLTYQGKAETSHATTRTYGGVTSDLAPTQAALPESLTLDFQTGIAANTLVFGSIHHAKWGDAHIYFDGASDPKTTWDDSTNVTLGVGRKLSDAWAVSASVNYEAATENTGGSLLSTTDGSRGVTLGARYTMENMTVSLGVNHTRFGDKTVSSLAGPGEFTGNSATTVGLNVGYSF